MNDDEDILSGPPPGRAELEAIVARVASRRRTWVWSAAAAAVVTVGAATGIGWAVADQSRSTRTVVAGALSGATPTSAAGSAVPGTGEGSAVVSGGGTATPVAGGGSGMPVAGGGTGMPAIASLKRLFVRTAGGVSARAFLQQLPVLAPEAASTACAVPIQPSLQAEVSAPGMVGVFSLPGGTGSAGAPGVEAAGGAVLGVAEQDPVYVAVVHTSSAVTAVDAVFGSGATDSMAPVDGWAVLVASAPVGTGAASPIGSVTVLGSGGKTLGTEKISAGYTYEAYPRTGCCPAIGRPTSGVTPSAGPVIASPAGTSICPEYAGIEPPTTTTEPANPPVTAVPGGEGTAPKATTVPTAGPTAVPSATVPRSPVMVPTTLTYRGPSGSPPTP